MMSNATINGTPDHFIVITLNHKNLSLRDLPDFSFEPDELDLFLLHAASQPDIEEIAGLCTCNRTEFFAAVRSVKDAAHAIVHDIAKHAGVSLEKMRDSLDVIVDASAVEHLFKLAAGLESMIIGDAQILGQVKQAYRHAGELGTCGRVFNLVFQKAFSVAKRIRRETGLGKGRLSISALAVEQAEQFFGTLTPVVATVIGAGKMGGLTSKYLKVAGVKELRIVNRSLERSLELANEAGGKVYGFDELDRVIAESDLVISATAAPDYLITKEMLENNPSWSFQKKLFVDIALPADIDPAITDLEGIHLIDLDSLREAARENELQRLAQIETANDIVEDELDRLGPWPLPFHIDALAVELGRFADFIYQDELQNILADMPELTPAQQEAIAARMKRLAERIILAPRRNMRKHKVIRTCPNAPQCMAELFVPECGARETPAKDVTTEEALARTER
ncbi:MAG TPA: glutamyl-tRNA reductase [bacterium]|nr:glutamyl-tRNA reductase [bacterium]